MGEGVSYAPEFWVGCWDRVMMKQVGDAGVCVRVGSVCM